MLSRKFAKRSSPLRWAFSLVGLASLATALSLSLLLGGCATSGHVQREYEDGIAEVNGGQPGERTVVLFLIDGLSMPALRAALARGDLPNLKRHFLSERGSRIHPSKTVFSSSTYPGISSILTTSPVSQHGIIGNRFRYKGEEVTLENIFAQEPLRELMYPGSVFRRLGEKGLAAVSLSGPFRDEALVSYPRRILDGIYYANHTYSAIDDQILESFEKLLDRTEPQRWPALIFVHLIGIDSLSHEFGPDSKLARAYFRRLDGRLAKALARLRSSERGGRKVISLLTADHGFMQRSRELDIEKIVARVDSEVSVIAEPRAAHLYFPARWEEGRRLAFLRALARQGGVAATAGRLGDSVYIAQGRELRRIDYGIGACPIYPYRMRVREMPSERALYSGDYECPDYFDRLEWVEKGAFTYPAIADFFQAPTRPDAVVTAAGGTSFGGSGRGQHGGLTRDEMIVPLLERNANVNDGGKLLASPALLNFLFE